MLVGNLTKTPLEYVFLIDSIYGIKYTLLDKKKPTNYVKHKCKGEHNGNTTVKNPLRPNRPFIESGVKIVIPR